MKFEASGTFEASPGFWDVIEHWAAELRQAADEDGGMHAVGVQVLVGYEEGKLTIEDCMMPLT